MGEEPTRGPHADQSGWVTTKVAAQALRVDPRTIRKYISQDKLEARVEGEGVDKTYLVSIDSVYALRSARSGPQTGRGDSPREAAGSAVSEDLVALVRDLTAEVSRRSSEAAELRTRLELTERAESSLREALEQRLETERVRREQAEREREELRLRLEAAVEARGTSETATEEPFSTHTPPKPMTPVQQLSERVEEAMDRGDMPPEGPGRQHPVERPSWWRRFFGFE